MMHPRALFVLSLAAMLWTALTPAQVQIDRADTPAAPPQADRPAGREVPVEARAEASSAAAAETPNDTNALRRAARLAEIAASQSEAATAGAAVAPSRTGESGGPAAGAGGDRIEPASPPDSARFRAETEAAYQAAWRAYYAYRTEGYAHRQEVFEWQDLSTRITFFVVIALVFSGVYFAAVQFHVGMRAGRKTGEAAQVELSLKGLQVRSPVLGVIVLSLSLAFFYLYLVYVYPIQNVS